MIPDATCCLFQRVCELVVRHWHFDDEEDNLKVLKDLWHQPPTADPCEFGRSFRYSTPKELGKFLWNFVLGAFDSIAFAPEKSSCLIDRLISCGDEVPALH